ncbi:MAG TPA: DUF5829 family protein, partial [Polyangiaceae bacterium]|nr:DUF5829 family protein [Polyangiaceae bacterium]
MVGACAARPSTPAHAPTPASAIVPAPVPAAQSKVRLNHVLGHFDAETATAIANNAFVNQVFAHTQVQTVHSDGRSWTGFYLHGRETYVEFFGPRPAHRTGEGGIGLGVDTMGDLDELARKIRSPNAPFEVKTRTTVRDGRDVPWFKEADIRPERDGTWLESWIMEYVPEYMALNPDAARYAPSDITRARYLAAKYQPERLVENVRGVHFVMPAMDRDEFAQAFTAYGWTVVRSGEDAIASNAGVELRVTADAARHGLVELRFGLTRPANRQEIVIGHSMLVVGP